jgi:hypothetical protein
MDTRSNSGGGGGLVAGDLAGQVLDRPADNTADADHLVEITVGHGVDVDGVLCRDSYIDLNQIVAPGAPGAGCTRLFTKFDDEMYAHPNGAGEYGLARKWTQETNFVATPASTSTLTMTADVSGFILPGYGLRYVIGGVTYYGIVTAVAANLLTVAGASMGADVTALHWCDSTRLYHIDFFVPGLFSDAADTTLLINDAHTAFRWELSTAYCVLISHKVRTDDSGANQPRVTLYINGAAVGTDNANAGLPVAETWTSTVIGISTANYDILRTEAVEVAVDANGSNKDAVDLMVSVVFLLP